MRLLFCSAQLPGHLDWGGYLATAVELAQRGHTVLWASGAAVGKRIVAAGLSFQVLEETGWRWPPPPPLPAPAASRRGVAAAPGAAGARSVAGRAARGVRFHGAVARRGGLSARYGSYRTVCRRRRSGGRTAGGPACSRRLARLRAQVGGAIRTGGPGTQAPCGAYTRVWTARTLLDAGRSAGFALTRPAYYLLEPILVWPAGAPAPDAPLWRHSVTAGRSRSRPAAARSTPLGADHVGHKF